MIGICGHMAGNPQERSANSPVASYDGLTCTSEHLIAGGIMRLGLVLFSFFLGLGVARGEVLVSPTEVDFGFVDIRWGGEQEFVYVRNTGPEPVNIDVEEFFCESEYIYVSSECLTTLLPNRSCSVRLVFDPMIPRRASCEVEIRAEGARATIVRVEGIGTDQWGFN